MDAPNPITVLSTTLAPLIAVHFSDVHVEPPLPWIQRNLEKRLSLMGAVRRESPSPGHRLSVLPSYPPRTLQFLRTLRGHLGLERKRRKASYLLHTAQTR